MPSFYEAITQLGNTLGELGQTIAAKEKQKQVRSTIEEMNTQMAELDKTVDPSVMSVDPSAQENIFKRKSQVAQQFAGQLSALGADDKASMIMQMHVPSAGAQYQAQANKDLQTSSQDFQRSEGDKNRKAEDRRYGQQLQLKAMEKMELRLQKTQKEAFNQRDKFNSLTKDLRSARAEAQKIQAALKPMPNGKIDQAQVNNAMITTVRAYGEKGPLNEGDIGRAAANQDYRSVIARKLGIKLSSAALKDDVAFYSAVGKRMEEDLNERIKKTAQRFSKSVSSIDPDIDEDRFQKALMLQEFDEEEAPAGTAAPQGMGGSRGASGSFGGQAPDPDDQYFTPRK
jgi:hypothetical protein